MPHRRTSNSKPEQRSIDRSQRDDGATITRRAPFSENPRVGARGQQTQQRILDAALRVFGEEGYHQCNIDRVAKRAGCSRVSLYQYFSGKEDVFRHLAGQVARQLQASIDMLDPITPDADGWVALRAWVARFADIYERYEPVFSAFAVASESDEAVAGGSERWRERHIAGIRSRLTTMALPPRQLDPLLRLLLECLTQTFDVAGILRTAAPAAYPRQRVENAVTDVIHRALFGLDTHVNVHAAAAQRPPTLEFGPVMSELLQEDGVLPPTKAEGRRALTALLESGPDVFVARGYHGTRVDDLVAAAGVSHGAFYRYFENKDQLARILTARAIQTVSTSFLAIPAVSVEDGAAVRTTLRRWLRRYNATQASQMAMIRVWVDAALRDPSLSAERAPAYDWGRRRMAQFLSSRAFGDIDTESVIMVALLSGFGAERRPASIVDAAAHIIERGLLGR